MSILLSDKVDFRTKKITRDKKGHYITLKGSFRLEEIMISNVNAPSDRVLNYMKQKV